MQNMTSKAMKSGKHIWVYAAAYTCTIILETEAGHPEYLTVWCWCPGLPTPLLMSSPLGWHYTAIEPALVSPIASASGSSYVLWLLNQ
jgi:hypothetical protein